MISKVKMKRFVTTASFLTLSACGKSGSPAVTPGEGLTLLAKLGTGLTTMDTLKSTRI